MKRARKAPVRAAKRPRYMRRARMARVPRAPKFSNQAMSVVRKQYLYSWQPSVATTDGFWRNNFVTLSSLNNVTDFTSLYDFYRINAVKFEWIPKFDSFSGNDTTDTTLPGSTNVGQPFVSLCMDNKAQTLPFGVYGSATYNAFLEQGRIKFVRNSRLPFSQYNRCVIIDNPNTNSTVTNNYVRSKWLPTSSTGVSHFIGQIYINDTNFSTTAFTSQVYDCIATFYMQFKGIR